MDNKGASMQPQDLIALGNGGWIGFVVSAIFGGVYIFRRLYHQDKISGVNASASVDALKRLYDLLDAERSNNAALQVLLAESKDRADAAIQAQNQMMLEMGELRAEVARLSTEVRMLRERHDEQN